MSDKTHQFRPYFCYFFLKSRTKKCPTKNFLLNKIDVYY